MSPDFPALAWRAVPALLVLILLAAGGDARADIYRWVDEDGTVHFSDDPHPGAERVDPSEPSVYRPRGPRTPVRSDAAEQPDEGEASGSPYTAFEIVHPEPDGTVRSAPGNLTVQLRISPSLRADHRLRIRLDGEPVATAASGTFSLQAVDRGTHALTAEILDARGEVLGTAGPVTFHMHRPSTNSPSRQ